VSVANAWAEFADGIQKAGRRLAESPAGSNNIDTDTDGYLALLRALNNLLGRVETDTERPELVAFNGWRQKFFMDNPDYRYWITDIRDDRSYQITGNTGGSAYQSITVYSGTGVGDAAAVSRIDSDGLGTDTAGDFAVTLSRKRGDAPTWLELPAGATSMWVRHVHDDIDNDHPGWCRIETADPPDAPPRTDADRLGRDLTRLGKFFAHLPAAFDLAVAADVAAPNSVRRWSAMAGGAAFTEPGIAYLRGSWRLEPGEALVVEGGLPPCRHWNIVLYNRFLNSLDHRHRTVSRTGATSTMTDGRYRFALADRDPGVDGYDWLDTEGRDFGLFVMRFLQPDTDPVLPELRRVRLDALVPRS